MMSRRNKGRLACSLWLCLTTASAVSAGEVLASPSPEAVRLILLGTAAGPNPRPDRSQPATVLVVGENSFLVDAGENVSQQIIRAGLRLSDIGTVLITHLHFDHVLGLAPMIAYSWVGGRAQPLDVYGPPGLRELIQRSDFALGIGAEIFRPELPPRGSLEELTRTHEISGSDPAIIYNRDRTRISVVANTHYAAFNLPPRPYGKDLSLSYRFDTPRGSIVLTGDTGPSAAVERLARGCDILVAEIVDVPSVMRAVAAAAPASPGASAPASPLRQHMEKEHLTPSELGRLAQRAGAKKLIVTHFAIGPGVDLKALMAGIRQQYPRGEIVLGDDLRQVSLN